MQMAGVAAFPIGSTSSAEGLKAARDMIASAGSKSLTGTIPNPSTLAAESATANLTQVTHRLD